jgi:hypothetical protein
MTSPAEQLAAAIGADLDTPTLHLATHLDGSQSLVTFYADGTGELATRPNPWATWGAPTVLEVAP